MGFFGNLPDDGNFFGDLKKRMAVQRNAENQAAQNYGAMYRPGPEGSMPSGWYNRANRMYRAAGYNPAAAAQGATRARNRGWLQYASTADDYWRGMENLANQYRQRASSIQTTSPGAAMLQGGMQGLGIGASYVPMFSGDTSPQGTGWNENYGTGWEEAGVKP